MSGVASKFCSGYLEGEEKGAEKMLCMFGGWRLRNLSPTTTLLSSCRVTLGKSLPHSGPLILLMQ